MDWLDLLAVQGTLRSLLQHHSSKASILRHSAFFMVQLSHPYMTTGKTIALSGWMEWALQPLYRFSTFCKVKCNFLQTFIKSFLYSRCCVYSSSQNTVVYYVLLHFFVYQSPGWARWTSERVLWKHSAKKHQRIKFLLVFLCPLLK